MDKNGFTTSPANLNKVCAKIQQVVSILMIKKMKKDSPEMFEHFSPALKHGIAGKGVSRCNVRKESVCRDGACSVQKQVECVDVCPLKGYAGADGIPKFHEQHCNASLCEGPHGAVACTVQAMMT